MKCLPSHLSPQAIAYYFSEKNKLRLAWTWWSFYTQAITRAESVILANDKNDTQLIVFQSQLSSQMRFSSRYWQSQLSYNFETSSSSSAYIISESLPEFVVDRISFSQRLGSSSIITTGLAVGECVPQLDTGTCMVSALTSVERLINNLGVSW